MAAVPMRQASLATAAPTRPPTATPRPTPRPTPTLVPTRDVGAMAASAASPMPAGLEWELASGRFFTQANGAPLGASMRGFALLDSGQQQFWSIYQQMGGVQALGYPTSQRFTWRGHTVQLTQRGLLQWSPATREMSLANLMDELHDRGWDDQLLREQFVPKQLSNEGEAGLSFAQVLARRMTLLDADPALKER